MDDKRPCTPVVLDASVWLEPPFQPDDMVFLSFTRELSQSLCGS